jgi:hypothetical protein
MAGNEDMTPVAPSPKSIIPRSAKTWREALVDISALGATLALALTGRLSGELAAMIIIAIAGVRIGAHVRSLPPGPPGSTGAIMLLGTQVASLFGKR